MLLSGSGGADLYDFVFRAYAPDLGAFTGPDDLAGQALDPITFNRYLYAAGDPATLVDPDGHASINRFLYDGGRPGTTKAGTSGLSPARQAAARKAEARVTSRAPRTSPTKAASAPRINRALAADRAMAGGGRDAWLRTEANQQAEFGRAAALGPSPLGEFIEGVAEGAPVGIAIGVGCVVTAIGCLVVGGVGIAAATYTVASGGSLIPEDPRGWGNFAGGAIGGWGGFRAAGAIRSSLSATGSELGIVYRRTDTSGANQAICWEVGLIRALCRAPSRAPTGLSNVYVRVRGLRPSSSRDTTR